MPLSQKELDSSSEGKRSEGSKTNSLIRAFLAPNYWVNAAMECATLHSKTTALDDGSGAISFIRQRAPTS